MVVRLAIAPETHEHRLLVKQVNAAAERMDPRPRLERLLDGMRYRYLALTVGRIRGSDERWRVDVAGRGRAGLAPQPIAACSHPGRAIARSRASPPWSAGRGRAGGWRSRCRWASP